MAEQISREEWLCADGIDISGLTESFGVKRLSAVDTWTPFPPPGSGPGTLVYVNSLAGAESMTVSTAGKLDQSVNLVAARAIIQNGGATVTKGNGRSPGDGAYLFLSAQGDVTYGGPVGKVIPFAQMLTSTGIIVSGQVFEFGTKTATGNGTGRTVPIVTTTPQVALYLHAHVVAVTGTTPTLDLIYETSLIGDYTDAVTRATFTRFTSTGVQRVIVSTAIADTHGRFRWTIGGTSPSFMVRLAAGVR